MMKMHARGAMVTNGDMTRQLLDPENETRKIERIETYVDDHGRHRVQIRWAKRRSS